VEEPLLPILSVVGANKQKALKFHEIGLPTESVANAHSYALPSRVRLHLSIGLHCPSGFKHHITVNACTLRLLPEERQV